MIKENASFFNEFLSSTQENPEEVVPAAGLFPTEKLSGWQQRSSGRGGGLRGQRRAVALGLLEGPLLLREERRAVRLVFRRLS